jgi:hypothetical protein
MDTSSREQESRLGPLLEPLESKLHRPLSKHTVKTQAVSIYRKLGTSSCSQAVQRLKEIGLLEG